jgi:hypothetical protein
VDQLLPTSSTTRRPSVATRSPAGGGISPRTRWTTTRS